MSSTQYIISTQADLQAAIDAGRSEDGVLDIIIPPNTYDFASNGTLPGRPPHAILAGQGAGKRIRIKGYGAKIKFNSSSTTGDDIIDCFATEDDVDEIVFVGIEFIGTETDDDKKTNTGSAIRIGLRNSMITIRDCIFRNCAAVTAIGENFDGKVIFEGNQILNCPNAVNLPTHSSIVSNFFINDELKTDRSHALYLYGRYQKCAITNNIFRNITDHGIKLRAGTAEFDIKHGFTITGNIFENVGGGCVELGGNRKVVSAAAAVTNNVAINCTLLFRGFSARDCVVSDNVMTWDWRSPFKQCGGIQIDSISPVTPIIGKGCIVTGNRLVLSTPFAGRLMFSAKPFDGDSVTVEWVKEGITQAVTYTFRDSPVLDTDVQIILPDPPTEVRGTAENLQKKLQGGLGNSPPINEVLREPADVLYDVTSQELVIASGRTFDLQASAGGRITETAVMDFRDIVKSGIQGSGTIGHVVESNYLEDISIPISLSNSIEPVIRNNVIKGWNNAFSFPQAILAQGSIFGVYEGNIFIKTAATDPADNRLLEVLDPAPVIRNNTGIPQAQTRTPTHLQGAQGIVEVGDGIAHTYLFYGDEILGIADPDLDEPLDPQIPSQTLHFRWNTGDTVLLDTGTGTAYTFTFRRDSPGASEFNNQLSLITLINDAGVPEFCASKLSTNIDIGHILIQAARANVSATGAFGNNYTLTVITKSRTCGVALCNQFVGGDAGKVNITPLFTRLAAKHRGPVLTAANRDARAIRTYIDENDVVDGMVYLIRHTGVDLSKKTPKWWYRI